MKILKLFFLAISKCACIFLELLWNHQLKVVPVLLHYFIQLTCLVQNHVVSLLILSFRGHRQFKKKKEKKPPQLVCLLQISLENTTHQKDFLFFSTLLSKISTRSIKNILSHIGNSLIKLA